MAEPNSAEEYLQRFGKSQQITGYGVIETTMHSPCPFCAAPDWAVFPVIYSEGAMITEHTCAECGRSGKFLFFKEPGTTIFEFVQTAGPDAPAWLVPAPRRVS